MAESSETPADSQKKKPKPKKPRNRSKEIARNKERRKTEKLDKVMASPTRMNRRQKRINIELGLLARPQQTIRSILTATSSLHTAIPVIHT